ncbi:MAG: methionine biosynthesis protein MetW [Gammaproteobacteria bacterium]|nr:MAG: methionine biosynthesis protein MetW [Gammaproteobacteria bacterium]
MRSDFEIIKQWINPRSSLLDLGCGDGSFLQWLGQNKQVRGYGLEIDARNITQCIAAGVNVIEQDVNKGLSNFNDQSFDTVLMTQALQTVNHPDQVLDEMLRIGKEGIITFPNFAYWRTRLYLLRNGRMPVSKSLPYTWYNTPNIHLCTFRDFEALCHRKQITILNRTVVDRDHKKSIGSLALANLFGEIAIYRVTYDKSSNGGKNARQNLRN